MKRENIMDLKQLETFITVVEWDSFSEAAKRLYLTQPTISTHIKQIENELNAELLKRTTKKLELTPEGREFYNYAKAISRIMESMQDSFSKKSLTTFNIGASSVPATYILPSLLTKYHKSHIKTLVNIIQSDSLTTIDGVINGSINIGIVGMTTMDKDLTFEKVLSDKLVVVTPYNDYYNALKKNNVKISSILKEPIIFREQGSGTLKESMKMIDALGISKNSLNLIGTANSTETLKQCIRNGMGISIMSKLSVEEEVANNQLISFKIYDFESVRHFYLVYRSNSLLSEPVIDFVKFTKKYLEENF